MRLVLSIWTVCFLLTLTIGNSLYAQHRCATMEAMESMYEQDGSLQKTIEQHIAEIHEEANKKVLEKGGEICAEGGTIMIPVVVHVLHDPNNPATNITEAQIESQICQLNADFGGTNQDLIEALDVDGNKDVTAQIAAAASDGTCIQFCLATFDHPQSTSLNPDGLTDGEKAIVRRSLAGLPTDFPPSYNNTPGDEDIWEISPIWNRNEYLNFWIVPSISIGGSNSILGFAQLPNGPANTDGIVMRAQNFGSSSPDCGPCTDCFLQNNFDWGRTAIHEVGHWMSLFHIWGSGSTCSDDDGITDTPLQFTDSGEFDCDALGFPSKGDQCTPQAAGGIMYMNYMDYSADACLILFSEGQQAAMETLMTTGFRSSFGTNNLEEIKCTPITDPPIAGFTYGPNPTLLCNVNGKIRFTDTSEDNPTQWDWSFTVLNGDIGIDIVSSSNRNPSIEVITGTSGTIEVELEASNSLGSDTFTETIEVTVSEDNCPSCDGGIFAGADITACPEQTVTLTPTLSSIGGNGKVATIGPTDLTGALQACAANVPQGSIDVVTFVFDTDPVNATITETGPGSITKLCVDISVTNNNGTYLSLDHSNGSYENLWLGTSLGGFNGDGGNTINVCFTAGESNGVFDGIFNGDSGGNENFIGQPSAGSFVLYIEDFGCAFGGTQPPTINSASLTISDGDDGFECQFLRWEVSGVEVSTDFSLDVMTSSGGTVFYTAVADCEGFICTDEVAINVLSSGVSTTVGTAENPLEVCGNEDSFEMNSVGPYTYDESAQTIAW
ncbi:MAG: M43 family zinc metalloprotease, partial [Chitinophagales bacterium]